MADRHDLELPQMLQGAQYAMGDLGLRLPVYMLGDAKLNERAKAVTDDFEIALAGTTLFVMALVGKKMPDLQVKSSIQFRLSRTVAVQGLPRSIASSKNTTTGYLTDFRIEAVHPEEVPEGVLSRFRREARHRTTDTIADSTAYLLSSAKLVQGSKIKRMGAVTEVAPQGTLSEDDVFTEFYDMPTYLTAPLGVQAELLDPALYGTPVVLRIPKPHDP